MNSANTFFTQFRDNKLAIYWLKNAIFSFTLSGIYLFIFLLFPPQEFSKLALIIHLNLSSLIGFISFMASIWSYNQQASEVSIIFVILAFISVLLIALSPFCGQNFFVISRCVAMLENIMFILGISLFGVSVLLFGCYTLYNGTFNNHNNFYKLINLAIFSTALLFILVWLCFSLSYLQLKEIIKLTQVSIEFYYELLFLSGGYLLQFVYTQILILVWIILFYSSKERELKFFKIYFTLLCLNFIIAILAPCGHLLYNILDEDFRGYYSKLGKYGNGIIPICSLILIWYDFIAYPVKSININNNSAKLILICSAVLFLAARFISFFMSPVPVILDYYHAPVLGITIAFIGFSYLTFSSFYSI